MPEGTVQAISRARSGKPTVTVDGQLYYTGKTDLTGMTVGDRISFDSNSSDFRGQTFWYLNAWKLLGAALKPPLPTQRLPEIPAPIPQGAPQKGFGLMTEGERLCISNWIGQAIAAKTLTEPEGIERWISAARNALRSQSE